MIRLYKALIGLTMLTMLTMMAYTLPARAEPDFTLSKSVADGVFTLQNNNAGLFVDELVVSGLGLTAGTTLPGWQASAFYFNDPLGCQTGTGFDFSSGFCYKLTDVSAGAPIGEGSQDFTYDSEFDDQSDPSDFFVLFTNAAGAAFACSGSTNTGCSQSQPALVPEPAPIAVFVMSLIGLGAMIRKARP